MFRVILVRNGGNGDLPGLSELPLNSTIEAARKSGSFLLDGTQRLNATFSDPNHFGFYIAVVFLVMLGATFSALFFEKPVSRRTAASYVLLTVSTAIAIVGTYSRSSWLLAGTGVLVLAAVLGRSRTRRRVIIAGVVGLIVLGLASPLIASRLSTSEPGNAESTQVHEHTMSIALKLVAKRPGTGVGLGDYGRHADQPALVPLRTRRSSQSPLNLGIPGLLLLLAAIAITAVAAIRAARHAPPADRAILAGFAAAYVGLAVANIVYDVWMDDFQWVLFGAVLALTTQPFLRLRRVRFRGRTESSSDGPSAAMVAPAKAGT